MRCLSTLAARNNADMVSVQKLGLGELPLRTDPKERGMSLVLRLAPLNDTDEKGVRAVVVKDVGGELARVQDLGEILDDPDKRHLRTADWYFFVLDARSDHALSESWDLGEGFLNLLDQQGDRPESHPRHCVVMYSCLDERVVGSDDPVVGAVLQRPNRLDGNPVDLNEYLEGMKTVETAICGHMRDVLPAAPGRLREVFKTIHYVGISSLGMTPAIPQGDDLSVESQCVCEPLLIRVHDPLFWVLYEDKRFWNAAVNGH